MPKKPTIVPSLRDYFRATGAELREWADTDPGAAAEIARRKARKAEKSAARVAA